MERSGWRLAPSVAPANEVAESAHEVAESARFWRLATGLSVATVLLLAAPDRVLAWLVPMLLCVQLVVISWALHEKKHYDTFTWRAIQLMYVLQIPASIGYFVALPRPKSSWALLNVVPGTLALVALGLGMAKALRPLLHVPTTARPIKAILVGSALVLASTQWLHIGSFEPTRAAAFARIGLCLGVAALLAGRLYVDDSLRRLGRETDLVMITAGCLFGFGQMAAFVRFAPSVPTKAFLYMPLASGIVAAAAHRNGMVKVGRPVLTVSDRPLTLVAPMVMATILFVDGVLVSLSRQSWSDRLTIVVFGAVIVMQLFGLVWLSGTLLGRPGTSGKRQGRRLAREFSSGLANGQFEAHFQPIFRATDLALVGYETLARWRHPRLGTLPAKDFLRIADDLGALAHIDRLMIRAAAQAMPQLFASTVADEPFITVNVEHDALQELGFAGRVLSDLAALSLKADGLVLELTETFEIRHWEELRSNVEQLQNAGIGLCIDDFGAGQANFGLLVVLDPDMVKFDTRLIEAAAVSPRGRLVVQAAIRAARTAGALIVAGGISNPQWIRTLQDMKFDMLQGFALGDVRCLADIAPRSDEMLA